MRPINKNVVWAIILWVLALMISCFVGLSHGSTILVTSAINDRLIESTIDIVELRGSIVDGKVLGTDGHEFTNIRFQPYGTPLIFDQSVLFCGYVGDTMNEFAGHPVIVTYVSRAHTMFEGIGCHELLRVERWKK